MNVGKILISSGIDERNEHEPFLSRMTLLFNLYSIKELLFHLKYVHRIFTDQEALKSPHLQELTERPEFKLNNNST